MDLEASERVARASVLWAAKLLAIPRFHVRYLLGDGRTSRGDQGSLTISGSACIC